jgi:1-acyl-sn-glycerol-3-phosphate acyltransferase
MPQILFPLRTAGFVGLTFSMYGLLELDTATHGRRAREDILRKWIQRYGRALLALYGVEVIARGPYLERGALLPRTDARGRGRVYVMNHRSGLDIPICLAHVEATIVSRADLARWPVIGVAARRVGTLFVDRSKRASGAAVIGAMCSALEGGRSVMVYPEGTTFAGDDVRPFHLGAFSAAIRTGTEVVPLGVAYEATNSAYIDEPFMDHMKRVSATARTRVGLVAGEAIAPDDRPRDMLETSRKAVQRLVHEARALLRD